MYVCKKKKLSDVLVKCNFIFCERKEDWEKLTMCL